MRHHNSVFHDLLKRVPWDDFDRLVAAHGADHRVRRLKTKEQLVALLYGQFSGAVSLREIVAGLESHSNGLYHVGGRAVPRSTLADANAIRPADVFTELFATMVNRAQRGLRRKIGEATYPIDATGLRLSGAGSAWAHFSAKACGAKLHVIYDANAERPVYAALTAARVNDITAAKKMPIEAGATYVFDLGYYDYAWWAALDAAGCRIVTRFKSNTPLTVTAELDLPEHPNILSDRIGLLPQRQARSRKNPFSDPVREVRVKTDTGKVLRILCNDLDASARDIADLYKRRWQSSCSSAGSSRPSKSDTSSATQKTPSVSRSPSPSSPTCCSASLRQTSPPSKDPWLSPASYAQTSCIVSVSTASSKLTKQKQMQRNK